MPARDSGRTDVRQQVGAQAAGITAPDEGLTGQYLLQQASEDTRGHLLRVQRACHALGGIRLHASIVPAIQVPKILNLPFAYREHQRRIGQGLLRRPEAQEQLHHRAFALSGTSGGRYGLSVTSSAQYRNGEPGK
ncbi:hypothetical protein AB5L52_45775 (plasmid) [Streptomyces sp. CG4]|uniref:hypothetical protein n=1 Tax=Streptomyces sp. CG4 TaxID=408783 RepID=UPI0034E21D83